MTSWPVVLSGCRCLANIFGAVRGLAGRRVVVFRVWKGIGTVIALFPGIDEGRGYCSSYEHVGQHSGADYSGVIQKTRPATPNEYQDLLKELRRIGYNLTIRRRWIRP